MAGAIAPAIVVSGRAPVGRSFPYDRDDRSRMVAPGSDGESRMASPSLPLSEKGGTPSPPCARPPRGETIADPGRPVPASRPLP